MSKLTPQQLEFAREFPLAFVLQDDKTALLKYLTGKPILKIKEDIVSVEKAGEGSMNYVLRITTNQRSFILKQSRPWVEKYPDMAAPVQRAIVEGHFYHVIQKDAEVRKYFAELLYSDAESFMLILEDLGKVADYTNIYKKDRNLSLSDLEALTEALSLLHNRFRPGSNIEPITNKAMRKLNHEHIFLFPLKEDTGFDLDAIQPGLKEAAVPYQRDEHYKEKVRQLGSAYLREGHTLLHGEYNPANWLNTENGPRIIDPEYCFFGHAEFDLGVMAAHLCLAQEPAESFAQLFRTYRQPEGFDRKLAINFMGVEIMRRLIGAAQLPLDLTIERKKQLLQEARTMILFPENTAVFAVIKE